MERAAKIAFAASAVVIVGLVALVVPAFSGFGATEPEAPAEAVGAAVAVAPAEPATAPELPDWAKNSGPWIIYPEGFRCQGTEGCPNDYRALIGEPGDVLPANVEYYDPATHDYDPANPGKFSVFRRPLPRPTPDPVPARTASPSFQAERSCRTSWCTATPSQGSASASPSTRAN